MKYVQIFYHLGNPVRHIYNIHRVIQAVLIAINIIGLLMLVKVP